MVDIKEQLKNLSVEPGVYIFKNKLDQIIYIGKAKSLKNRVRSYWNESSWKDRAKLKILVPKVKQIETIVTKSEKEALILESNLVFKHQPRYNVLLKANDKQFPWLVITYDENYPRLIPVREVDKFNKKAKKNTRNKFFGPYTNVGAMYENLRLVNELFPLRKRYKPQFRDRPCLNYDIGQCLGPCQQKVSQDQYALMLEQVEMLLKGNYQDLQKILSTEMKRYSDNQEYEKAAKARDRIYSLETFNEAQNVVSEDHNLDQDVFAMVHDETHKIGCVQVFKTRKGKLNNRDSVEIDLQENFDDDEIFISAFEQYYSLLPETEIPKEILLSQNIESIELYEEWLSEKRNGRVKIFHPQRGDKYAQVNLAKRNARVILEKIKLNMMEDASKNINVALDNLQRDLGLLQPPHRMECYDISHIQGSATVASMVCFIDGMPAKDEYRRFKISKDQNDDFASMKEVISRRFKKELKKEKESSEDIDDHILGLEDEESHEEPIIDQSHITEDQNSLPDLVIIDGGKGQLSSAREVMQELGFEHIRTIGLAKREEEIYLPNESKPIILDRKSPELFLIQRIRNEAHRFAITYHRKLRSQRSTRSKLEDVPGLGPKKRKILLDAFGTLTKIREADVNAIADLKGFNQTLAETVKNSI
jgi:excinuclease ABC subunit C